VKNRVEKIITSFSQFYVKSEVKLLQERNKICIIYNDVEYKIGDLVIVEYLKTSMKGGENNPLLLSLVNDKIKVECKILDINNEDYTIELDCSEVLNSKILMLNIYDIISVEYIKEEDNNNE
jgi:hypothetical protein